MRRILVVCNFKLVLTFRGTAHFVENHKDDQKFDKPSHRQKDQIGKLNTLL
jgi:hypothetical protein